VRRSRLFEGNASEAKTLEQMLEALGAPQQALQALAIVRFDAHGGIERKRSDDAVSVQANAGLIGVKRSGRN